MRLGTSLYFGRMIPGSFWKLDVDLNGYASDRGIELVTQASSGRCFEILQNQLVQGISTEVFRLKVRLLEDGYECWFDKEDVLGNVVEIDNWQPKKLVREEIRCRIPAILKWLKINLKIKYVKVFI